MSESSDSELLAAVRAGDARALESLLMRHQQRIYRFGVKMCRDPEDASDVLQETLLAMARSVKDFRGASSISTWLYTIARSFCIKKRRHSKFEPPRHESIEARPELPDPGRSPEEETARREIERALEEAIADLDPEQREVLVLRDVEGLTAPEVAEVLGISVGAVKTRLHRARLALRHRIGPALGVPVVARRESCPDVLTLFSQHLEGEIDSELCREMEQHLAQCSTCHASCDSLKKMLALCGATPTTEIPDNLQKRVQQALRRFVEASS